MVLVIAPALFDLIIAHFLKKQGYSRVTNAAEWIQYTAYMLQDKIHQLYLVGLMLPYC